MIVRISGEDQYRLEGVDGQVNELDNAVVAAVEAGDERRFHSCLRRAALVRAQPWHGRSPRTSWRAPI